jgi:UPF0042 nucleotide-binding protein
VSLSPAPVEKDSLRFVIITGLSGAGKSYAIKVLEDLGYFCVDNLPTTLIPTFAELCAQSNREIRKIALGVDVREGAYLAHLLEILQELRGKGHVPEVLFLEAADEALVADGIRAEKQALAHLRDAADRIIDTSGLTVHQLKERLIDIYAAPRDVGVLTVSLVSFGYKHGIPYDADLVFDVRFLPNPHFVAGLRALDGRDGPVADFVFSHAESRELLQRLEDLIGFLLPLYRREGKAYLSVAIGCTGGRHRSVALVEALRRHLEAQGDAPLVRHRDLGRE